MCLVSITPGLDEWRYGNPDRLVRSALVSVVFFGMFVWGVVRLLKVVRDYVAKPMLYTARVGARYDTTSSRWRTNYFVHVGKLRFDVPLQLYENLRSGDEVAVTCKPHSPCLLRLELVSRGTGWGAAVPKV